MTTRLNSFNAFVQRVNAATELIVSPFVSPKFALLDFPNHANVGDSAIWLGEIALFRKLVGAAPSYVSDFRSFDESAMKNAIGDGTIFLHGGGNFGDIWEHHQTFRENIIERFRDYKIVQMPQSIHYGNVEKIDKIARIIARHPDFSLLVRDVPSLNLAQAHFECPVYLCADTAFSIGSRNAGPSTIDVLAMLRTDKERVETTYLPSDVLIEDWLINDTAQIRRTKAMGIARAWATFSPANSRLYSYQNAARARVERGFRQLARGKAIVTDRLHVHILSILLARPHAVLDNHYGKIGRFIDAFTHSSPLVYRAKTMDEAVNWARTIDINTLDE